MSRKIVPVCLSLVLVLSAPAMAFTVKGYQWGRPLAEMRKDLEVKRKKAVFDEKTWTLVFPDKVFGKECEVSLLFTPKTKLLAGIAMVWSDPEAATLAKEDLTRKYGPPLPSGNQAEVRKVFLWSSPTSRFDRITLVAGLKRTIMAYYGGEYYRKYMEESAQVSGKPVSEAMPAEAQVKKK